MTQEQKEIIKEKAKTWANTVFDDESCDPGDRDTLEEGFQAGAKRGYELAMEAKFNKWCEDYHKLNGMIEIPHDLKELQKQRDNFLLGIRITIATTPDKDTAKYLTDVIKVHNLEP